MVGKGFVGLTESKLIYEEVSFVGRMGSRIHIEKRGYRELFCLNVFPTTLIRFYIPHNNDVKYDN